MRSRYKRSFRVNPASILDPREVSRARVGPRDLKPPVSREYAIQTIYALKQYLESRRIDEERVRRELAVIDQHQHWVVLGYPTKAALLEAETGYSEDDIERKIVLARHGGGPKEYRGQGRAERGSS